MASNANLGERLEAFVDEMVKTGRFQSRGDVLREGVRMVEERENRLAALDAAIERGLADADAGRIKPIEEVAERLIDKYRAGAKEAGR